MCKMQKRQVYDIKKLENTTVPSLHDRGQPTVDVSGLDNL